MSEPTRAPDSVVRAVMEALGCKRGETTGRCQRHAVAWFPVYPCPTAQAAADAAWAAARREALLEAAERFQREAKTLSAVLAGEVGRPVNLLVRETAGRYAAAELRRMAEEGS